MVQSNYTYPDSEDQFALAAMAEFLPSPNWWKFAETQIVRKLFSNYRHLAKETIVDLGCGQGRHLPFLSHQAKRVFAIEPDSTRMRTAKQLAKKHSLENVVFVQGGYQALRRIGIEPDLVFCSHVVQHLKSSEANELLDASRSVLKTDGVIIFATSRTHKRDDIYTVSQVANGSRPMIVPRKQFDSAISLRQNGVLATRLFCWNSLKSLGRAHFETVKIYPYNNRIIKFFGGFPMAREKLCRLPVLKWYLGMDAFVTCRHPKTIAQPANS